MASQAIAILSAAALVAGGFAVGSETRSMGALPRSTALVTAGAAAAAEGEKCLVEVIRTRAPGTSQVERDERPSDGRCICRIFTGPEGRNGAAEAVVDALWRDRECTNAPAAPIDGSTAGSAGAAGGGGLGGAVLPVVFGVGAIGLGVGLSGASKG